MTAVARHARCWNCSDSVPVIASGSRAGQLDRHQDDETLSQCIGSLSEPTPNP